MDIGLIVKSAPAWTRNLDFHGLTVQVQSWVEDVVKAFNHLFGPMTLQGPMNDPHVRGLIRPYEPAEVARCVSPRAKRLPSDDPTIELYQEDERIWMVDERWGMSELNLLKSSWRSWLLPQVRIDPLRLAEQAALWPLAQIARQRGLHAIPAAALIRRGWGVLMLSPIDLGPELIQLVRAGYRLIGQRWCVLRDDAERATMLRLPGAIEHRGPGPAAFRRDPAETAWIDLEGEFPGSAESRGQCHLAMIVERARQGVGRVNHLGPEEAAEQLRAAWTIAEPHASPRLSSILMKLSQKSQVVRVQLPQDPGHLIGMLNSIRVLGPSGVLTNSLFGRWKYGSSVA